MENRLQAITKEMNELHVKYAEIDKSFMELEHILNAMEDRMLLLEKQIAKIDRLQE